jgi:uncharacterized protein YecE (DUF72 family)
VGSGEAMARVVVGTSSWADPGFVEEWYPQGLPAGERLPWYARHFEAVELNSSFYALPERSSVERWAQATPPCFSFDVKLHRLLSRHAAPLDSLPRDLRCEVRTSERGRVELTEELEAEMVERLEEAVQPLAATGKLGAYVLQLSPAFSPRRHELSELDGLVGRLAPRPVAIEFRHRGWVDPKRLEDTLDQLGRMGAAYVCVDAPPGDQLTIMPPLDAVTDPRLAYMRLHGRNREGYVHNRTVAERFDWEYSDAELEEIRGRVGGLAEEAAEVRVMFNNNSGDKAPRAAERFRELLGRRAEAARA